MAEADFFEDAPLVLTASRMSKPLEESPASVTVIDRQMIASSGARKLADIFRLVPGFIVGNLNGNKPVVTYQGLGSEFARRLQVLIDGRSVFIPSFGGVSWTNLPLLIEDIERIEVIRGPNAVTYGANAFLATINIITRDAAEDIGARYSITASDNANPEVRDAYFRLGYHFDNVDWRLSAGSLSDDGFRNIFDSRQTSKFNFRLDYNASNRQFWTIQAGSSISERGLGEAGDPTGEERYMDAGNQYLNITWEQVRSKSSTRLRLAYTAQEVTDNYVTDPFLFNGIAITTAIDFDRISNRTDLELVQNEEFSDSFRLVYGANIRKDRVKSFFLANDRSYHEIDTSRLFSSIEWRLGRELEWILDFGASVEESSYTDTSYSPRISVLRRINQNHMLRFVASRAKRNPVLYEYEGLTVFTANMVQPSPFPDLDVVTARGNPDILPEDIISYEIGLRSQFDNRAIASDVKIFSYKLSDYINTEKFSEPIYVSGTSTPLGVLTSEVDTTFNEDIAIRVNGIDLSFDTSPMANLDIKTGLSFVQVESDISNIEDSFPQSTAFISSEYRWLEQHSLSASLYYFNDMEWVDSQDPLPATSKLDFRYSYIFDKITETQIELIGQNLLEEYEDYFTENINEKIIMLRISGGF
ncbi:MAG: TonB-dependent receptor [Gammaproteobacteria bacterium]|nr:TonB-dependent receptor [Gammaproteobacteria bacterium]